MRGKARTKPLEGWGKDGKGKTILRLWVLARYSVYAKLGTIMWAWRFSTSNQQNQEQRGKFMVHDKRKGTIGGKLSKYNTCLVVVKKTQLAQFF